MFLYSKNGNLRRTTNSMAGYLMFAISTSHLLGSIIQAFAQTSAGIRSDNAIC